MTDRQRGSGNIDPDKVRVSIRKLEGENLLEIIDRAIDLLPPDHLVKLVDGFVSPDGRAVGWNGMEVHLLKAGQRLPGAHAWMGQRTAH